MSGRRAYEDWKVSIPEGVSGRYRVEHVSVSKADAERDSLAAMISQHSRSVPEGRYTMLYRGGTLVMSDTPDEIRDHSYAVHQARGRVLIAGLGIGMVARKCLLKDEVEHVTVVELAPEVIELVGTHMLKEFGRRLDIINADIFDFKPPKGVRYGMAWFDIWDNICTDNLSQMATLHRRFARHCDWYGSWTHELLKYRRRQEQRAYW